MRKISESTEFPSRKRLEERPWAEKLSRQLSNAVREISRRVNFLLKIHDTGLSADPPDPDENSHIIWQSDGTDSGDDGDIMMKITDSSGTTKTKTLVDFT